MREEKHQPWKNWTGNQQSTPVAMLYPQTEAELIEIVKQAKAEQRTVRAAGAGYSWAPLIVGADYIVSLERYNQVLSYDAEKHTITCQAGMRFSAVAAYAKKLGWSLLNVAYIDFPAMGSILSTSTHGCGKRQPILAEDIVACRIINGAAEIVELTNADEDFAALKAGLGLLGLVSTVTIQCQPVVSVIANNQVFNYQDWFAQLSELQEDADFSHTFWMPHTDRVYLVSANITSTHYEKYQCTNKQFWDKFSFLTISWLQRCSTYFPSLVPWLNRIMFALGFRARQCTGDMYQVLSIKSKHHLYNCEYSFPVDIGKKVIEEIKVLTDSKKLLLPGLIEVRPIKADKNFLSVAYGEEVLAIGCSICSNGTEVPAVLYQLEEIFIRHQGRPHLVKNFSIDQAYLKKVYPKLEAFQAVIDRYDPNGTFRTAPLAKLICG